MTNQITATIEFSFKGETHRPSAELELDQLMQQHGTIPPLHAMLATLHNIGSYSYEYEMLEAEDVKFSNAKGEALNFFNNNQFDLAEFEQDWHEKNILIQLGLIVKQNLNIDDIQQHPKLKNVILAAYQLGKKTNSISTSTTLLDNS